MSWLFFKAVRGGLAITTSLSESIRKGVSIAKISQLATVQPVGLKGLVCVVVPLLRIASDMLLTYASHPDTFEAKGMPFSYDSTH